MDLDNNDDEFKLANFKCLRHTIFFYKFSRSNKKNILFPTTDLRVNMYSVINNTDKNISIPNKTTVTKNTENE